MPTPPKVLGPEYLGDSVYFETDVERDGFIIYTDNGLGRENVIFLEHAVVKNLIDYLTRAYALISEAQK